MKRKALPTTMEEPSKRVRKGKYPPITDPEYSRVGGEEAAYSTECSVHKSRKLRTSIHEASSRL